jgi:hypothetical protein
MKAASTFEHSTPDLLYKLQQAIRAKKITSRAEHSYQHWINRYVFFNDMQNPAKLDERNVKEFLSYLATSLKVSPAKQNQALIALNFLYAQVLNKPLQEIHGFVKARRTDKLMLLNFKKSQISPVAGTDGSTADLGTVEA